MNLRKEQVGASFIGMFMLVIVVGSIITIGTKLVPLYIDHNTMSGQLDRIAAEDGLAGKHKRDLYAAITKRFKLNGIRDFDVKDNIDIVRTANGVEVKLDYEVRVPLVHNVDLIAAFNKEIELRK